MPCTAPYSRASKISPVDFNRKSGTTFIELTFSLLIFTLVLIPVGFGIQMFTQSNQGLSESMFMTKIKTRIMHASSESLYNLKESKIVYNKGCNINGFVFQEELRLEFTHYGQIKGGDSVKLIKNKELYILSVRPITGFASLEKE